MGLNPTGHVPHDASLTFWVIVAIIVVGWTVVAAWIWRRM